MPSSQFFSAKEITCKCGCATQPADDMLTRYTLQVADSMREALASQLRCLSGRRCERHNKAVGGVPTSMHLHFAMDLQPTNPELFDRLVALSKSYYDRGLIDGLGLYPTFVHIDLRKMLFRSRAKWGSKTLWEPQTA